jgi:ABC-type sugar transport system permease subunit
MTSVRPSHGLALAVVFVVAISVLSAASLWMLLGQSLHNHSPLSDVISDREFWQSAKRTLIFAISAVILKAVLAWLLVPYFYRHGDRIITSLLLIPWVVPTSVAAIAWLWFFYDVGGGANSILAPIRVDWLGNPRSAFGITLAFNVWRETPLWALALASSLSGGRAALSRLAQLDGLSRLEHFRLVALPRVLPVLCALALLSTIWAVGEFETVWLLTQGGPGEATELLAVYAFKHAYLSQDLAFGVASYLCMFPIIFCILLPALRLYRRAVERASL